MSVPVGTGRAWWRQEEEYRRRAEEQIEETPSDGQIYQGASDGDVDVDLVEFCAMVDRYSEPLSAEEQMIALTAEGDPLMVKVAWKYAREILAEDMPLRKRPCLKLKPRFPSPWRRRHD